MAGALEWQSTMSMLDYSPCGIIYADEDNCFEVYKNTTQFHNADKYIVTLVAVSPEAESGEHWIIQPVSISRTLSVNPLFKKPEIRDHLLAEVGLANLKRAVREDCTPRPLPEICLCSNNWTEHVERRDGELVAKGIDEVTIADRQIAKRLIVRHLFKGVDIADSIQDTLGLDWHLTQTVLNRLDREGYVYRNRDAWHLTDKGERVIAAKRLKEEFPVNHADETPAGQPVPAHTVIHIHGGNIGLLNTGHIQTISGNISVLSQSGEGNIAEAFKTLSEEIGNSKELQDDEKNEALSLLGELSAEATKPQVQRRPTSIITSKLAALGAIIQSVGGLASVWDVWGRQIAEFFGRLLL